jgi:hypothetical protein
MPPDDKSSNPETLSKLVDRALTTYLKPELKARGFSKKGKYFYRPTAEYIDTIYFHLPWYTTRESAPVYLRAGIFFPAVAKLSFPDRYPKGMPSERHLNLRCNVRPSGWVATVTSESDFEQVARGWLDIVDEQILTWFDPRHTLEAIVLGFQRQSEEHVHHYSKMAALCLLGHTEKAAADLLKTFNMRIDGKWLDAAVELRALAERLGISLPPIPPLPAKPPKGPPAIILKWPGRAEQ